jgi:hypothetical protein
MKAPIIALFIFSVYGTGFAQVALVNYDGATVKTYFLTSDLHKGMTTDAKVEGTVYFSEELSNGTIYTRNRIFSNLPMRYNIFDDNIEFQEKDTVLALLPDPFILKVEYGERTFVVDYLLKEKGKAGFFHRLDSGKLTLMAKMAVTFLRAVEEKAMQPAKPAQFKRLEDVYYYKIGNGPVTRIQSVKKLIESLPDHNDEMQDYVRTEKISLKDGAELTKLVKYYNSR